MKHPQTELSSYGVRAVRQLRRFKTKRERTGRSLPAVLFLFAASLFFATEQSQAQCPLHLPSECQQIENERKDLVAEKEDLQAELKKAAGSEKGAIANQIKKLLAQIAAKQKQVDSCTTANGLPPLQARLDGLMSMSILEYKDNPNSTAASPITIDLTYMKWVHDQVIVKFFPELQYDYFNYAHQALHAIEGLQSDFSTSCGEIDPKTGRLSLTFGALVHVEDIHKDKTRENKGSSHLAITLSTDDAPGSRFDSKGKIRLFGEGVFKDGPLMGLHCRMFIEGTLSPLP